MTEHAIPKSVSTRLLKRAGADRVAEDAKDALASTLETYAATLAREALKIARMEGRTTVRAADIERARLAMPGTNG